MEAFGLHLYKLRQQRGFSQQELADLANISRSQILRIEQGQLNTSISTLYRLALAFEITPAEMLNFEY